MISYRDTTKVSVTVTIGISGYAGGRSMQSILDKADSNLYYGMKHGKNRVVAKE